MNKQRIIKSLIFNFVIVTLSTVIFILLLEGATNLAHFISKLRKATIAAESVYTEYDSELGWISRKNQYIENMFGDNIFLATNSQRFRNSSDITINRQVGKKRWIYVGDSFTFGYGVDNDHSYSSYISEMVPEIEYVNMGQGGYGCDQMYLWYMRDGIKLEHDVMIFAFITDDFERMYYDKFLDYPKPHLEIVNDQIRVMNAPVPQRSFMARNFPRYIEVREQLGIDWLASIISNSIDKLESNKEVRTVINSEQEFAGIITRMLYNLNNELIKRNGVALFVYLPKIDDYYQDESRQYRDLLKDRARYYNWNYIDLVEEYRKIHPDSRPSLFIQKGIPGYLDSEGHYTTKGNEVIANMLLSRIHENPKISSILP